MAVIIRPDVIADQQASNVGLPDGSVIGIPGLSVFRMIDALPSGEVGTGIQVVFGGEYLCDSDGGFVADANSFMLGFPPVLINRLV